MQLKPGSTTRVCLWLLPSRDCSSNQLKPSLNPAPTNPPADRASLPVASKILTINQRRRQGWHRLQTVSCPNHLFEIGPPPSPEGRKKIDHGASRRRTPWDQYDA